MHLRKALAFAAASLVAARTPDGFEPASENELVVVYGDTVVTSGDVLEQSSIHPPFPLLFPFHSFPYLSPLT